MLEEVGGVDYLVRLAESTPTAANAVEHARLVRDKATIRDLIRAAGEILHDAHSTTAGADQVLQEAESRIFTIAQRRDHLRIVAGAAPPGDDGGAGAATKGGTRADSPAASPSWTR